MALYRARAVTKPGFPRGGNAAWMPGNVTGSAGPSRGERITPCSRQGICLRFTSCG